MELFSNPGSQRVDSEEHCPTVEGSEMASEKGTIVLFSPGQYLDDIFESDFPTRFRPRPQFDFFAHFSIPSGVFSLPHLAQAWGEIPDELHQVLHRLDDLRHAQIVEHLFAFHDNLAHLGFVENEQDVGRALQNPPGTRMGL